MWAVAEDPLALLASRRATQLLRGKPRPDLPLEESPDPVRTRRVSDPQAQPRPPLEQGLPHRFGLALARERGDLLDQLFDLEVLDVQGHCTNPEYFFNG